MALVTAQAFYRIYDDTGVPLAEGLQDGTVATTCMMFTNTGAQADRTLRINHNLDGWLVKDSVGAGATPERLIEARWIELYGYTAGTVHPGYQFDSPAGSPNAIRAHLIGVPTMTTYRGTLVIQKLHTITQ